MIRDFSWGSGIISVKTVSLRTGGFEAYTEVTPYELENTLGAERPKAVWEKFFSPPSLEETYQQALDLEKEGNFKEAFELFKKIDDTRKDKGDWVHSADNPLLIYREAQDRVELYTLLRLKQPKLIKLYLEGRKTYLSGQYKDASKLFSALSHESKVEDPTDKAGFGQLADYLGEVCRAQLDSSDAEASRFLNYIDKHPSPRAYLTLASDFTFPEEGNLIPLEKTLPRLKRILKDYPSSRYADDAAYILTSIAISQNDWPTATKYFRELAEHFNHDDLVPKGRLMDLAAQAATQFQKASTLQAFWELAGGTGDYTDEEEQWNQLKPFYRPYFILEHLKMQSATSETYPGFQFQHKRHHKIMKRAVPFGQIPHWKIFYASYDDQVADSEDEEPEKDNKDDRERLLTDIVQNYPNHPTRAEALLRLADYYESLIGYDWKKPEAQEAAQKSKKLYEELLTEYPRSEEAGYSSLVGLEQIFQGEQAPFSQFLPWVEKVHQNHLIEENLFQGLPYAFKDFKEPPFKDPELNEMYLVAKEDWGKLISTYPNSQFAPWAFLKTYNEFESNQQDFSPDSQQNLNSTYKHKQSVAFSKNVQVPSEDNLKDLLFYGDWFLAHHPKDANALMIRVKMAKIHLESGFPALALKEAGNLLSENTQDNPWLDEVLWVQARALEALGREDEALKAYRDFVQKYPADGKPFTADLVEGHFQIIKGQNWGWYGNNLNPKAPGTSPYTEFALGKIALYDEDHQNYPEALKIYLDMGDQVDSAILLDAVMPINSILDFMAQYPQHPSFALVKYSLGIRYFRAQQFDDALNVLKDDPISADILKIKNIYEDIQNQTDPNQKALAEYKAAQYFYRQGGECFNNKQLWHETYGNFIEGRNPEEQKLIDESKQLQDARNLAAEGFQRIIDLYPNSPLRDRALYSYSLCRLKESSAYPGYNMTGQTWEDKKDDFVSKFDQLYQEYPKSTLADDALLWAYFFTHDDKYLTELSKNTNQGDVRLFFTPLDIKNHFRGYYDNYADPWWMFFKHNEYLDGTDFSDIPQATLLGSQLDNSFTEGEPYSGWYYFRGNGKNPYDAVLNLDLQGVDEFPVMVNFNGQEASLPADAVKNFQMKLSGLPPGIAQWINVRIPQTGDKPLSMAGTILSNIDGQSFETSLDSITALPVTAMLEYKTKDQPVNQDCIAATAFYVDPVTSQSEWALKGNDGKTWIYNGLYGQETSDLPVQQFIFVNGTEIRIHDTSRPLKKETEIATCFIKQEDSWMKKAVPLYPLPPYGRYAHGILKAEAGFLVDERDEKITKLPDEVEAGTSLPPDPQIEIEPAEGGGDQHLMVSGLNVQGLSDDNRDCYPGPEKVLEAHYLGYSHDEKIYLYLRCSQDDKVEAFFPNGKSAGLFWLSDKMGKTDDFKKLKYLVLQNGTVRFFSFLPDKKALHFDDLIFNGENIRNINYY